MLTRLHPHRFAIAAGVLVGLAILLVTQDEQAKTPYILLLAAFIVAMIGLVRTRPHRAY